MEFELPVLPHQQKFLESKKALVGLVAGYASGKTFASTAVTVLKKLQYPEKIVVAYLPTYIDIKDIAFERVPDFLKQLGYHYQINKSAKEIHVQNYGKILFRNMSKPETIIGYESVAAVIDECDVLPTKIMHEAFNKILARNRATTSDRKRNQIFVVGTPEGRKWFYDRFVTRKHADNELIHAKTTDNPFLPKNYINNLKESYDEILLKQYINGEFVNINSHSVYHQFDRAIHVVPNFEINPKIPLIISFDFNINPYSAVYLMQEIGGSVYVLNNCIKKHTALVDVLAYLKKKFAHLGDYLYTAKIYGDATGGARSQGTGLSNYDLIREAGWSNQLIKRANPRVHDRVNRFNNMLKNGNGKVRLFVCERNKELINDLEQLSYDKIGRVDKTNLDLSHDTDSIGYYLEYQHPISEQKELKVTYA